jgi:deoxyribodipyrimidine photo-lyase
MAKKRIQQQRIQPLNDRKIEKGQYVLYWMQQSQRAEYNHALEYAIEMANHLRIPLLVVFGLMTDYPEANRRHYTFMLEGLLETQEILKKRGIKMVVRKGHPADVASETGKKAAAIICDRGYLRHHRNWRHKVAAESNCRVVQVESDVVVPVGVVSEKAEYAARTIRPKIHRHLNEFLTEVPSMVIDRPSVDMKLQEIDISRPQKLLDSVGIDTSVVPVSRLFFGGTSQAKRRLNTFIRNRLARYDQNSNQPQTDDISHMSPYLHFGQISPLYLALTVKKADDSLKESKERYLEELIVRRELAINFTLHARQYDSYDCVPEWAKRTLSDHRNDKRYYSYNRKQLENAKTHDAYWNAAMNEMKYTGFMHNYMRMYWGKKILEWSTSPQKAFATTLAINNKYFIDGRDPNSYTGVAWIYGVHDRAWGERPIFGKIRYMAASGLERKCDIKAYVEKVEGLIRKNTTQKMS